jgi:hypothetical protein
MRETAEINRDSERSGVEGRGNWFSTSACSRGTTERGAGIGEEESGAGAAKNGGGKQGKKMTREEG